MKNIILLFQNVHVERPAISVKRFPLSNT